MNNFLITIQYFNYQQPSNIEYDDKLHLMTFHINLLCYLNCLLSQILQTFVIQSIFNLNFHLNILLNFLLTHRLNYFHYHFHFLYLINPHSLIIPIILLFISCLILTVLFKNIINAMNH